MTLLGQMLMEDGVEKGIKQGIEQGMEKGEFKALQDLIKDGVLTAREGAARKGMTEEEFQDKLKELSLI